MTDKVAIQGDKASFHDIAAAKLFGESSGRKFCNTFGEVFAALKSGEASLGLCAIENSIYGSINQVYDLLLKHRYPIIGEIYLRIEHCLIGLPGADIGRLTKVYSHPVALAQCTAYLDDLLPEAEREEYYDTATSVAFVKQTGDPTLAAIAGREAAELYGLKILAESIETDKANFTRFVAIGKTNPLGQKPDKTSLVLTIAHQPGTLYAALGAFAKRGINVTKLQSRPIIGKAWHYMFYIDVAAGEGDESFRAALDELAAQDCEITKLGSYQSGTL